MTDKRIRLFVSDIDGCLAEPFAPFDLDGMIALRKRAVTARQGHAPELSICTGRGFGYVEAMVQAIGFELPVLFEAGGGMYNPKTYSIDWAPSSTQDERDQVADLLRVWEDKYSTDPDISIDFFKRTQASIVIRDSTKMSDLMPEIAEHVRTQYDSMELADTSVSIDVYPHHLSKKNGVAWLSDVLGIPLDAMGFIGDSTGDIGAIQTVGIGSAPANASAAVKSNADYVCESNYLDGVIEAFDHCVGHNANC